MAFRRTYLESEPQRINRWLGGLGVCSRREAEALILAGRVRIDEVVVTEPGRKISQGETLSLSDAEGGGLEPRFTVLIHKPVGIVSAQPEAGEIPAVRLLTAECLQGDAPLIPPTNMSLPALGRKRLADPVGVKIPRHEVFELGERPAVCEALERLR